MKMDEIDKFLDEVDSTLVENDVRVNTAVRVDRLFEAGVAPVYNGTNLRWGDADAWLRFELLDLVYTELYQTNTTTEETEVRLEEIRREREELLDGVTWEPNPLEEDHICDVECEELVEGIEFPVLGVNGSREYTPGFPNHTYRHFTQYGPTLHGDIRYRINKEIIDALPDELFS